MVSGLKNALCRLRSAGCARSRLRAHFALGPSALAKRYIPESGDSTVDALFEAKPSPNMVGTVLGYSETHSVLVRNLNRGTMSAAAYAAAKSALRAEVVDDPSFTLLTVDDAALYAGIRLVELYNLNANDGAILAVFLRYLRILPPPVQAALLIASDRRLLAAAQAEGLQTLDPETVAPPDVPALLASM